MDEIVAKAIQQSPAWLLVFFIAKAVWEGYVRLKVARLEWIAKRNGSNGRAPVKNTASGREVEELSKRVDSHDESLTRMHKSIDEVKNTCGNIWKHLREGETT